MSKRNNMIDKKHKKAVKRKKIVARKIRAEVAIKNRSKAVGYYEEIKGMMQHYKKDSPEFKKLSTIATAFEKWQQAKKDKKRKGKIKSIPMYRVVILTRRLDKTIQTIKSCEPGDKKLKGLKEKKKILEIKLKNNV